MALKGYFIQATFEDGTEVSAYAAYDGTWYYFYTDRRFRFTLTSAGAVDIQQYQPIGSNMAWYDINIITAVSVEQFDPDNSGGGGAVPEDVYTKEEVNQLIAAAVQEVEKQIPDLVAQAVQAALDGLDDRYVLKAGDTMTGALTINENGERTTINGHQIYMYSADNVNTVFIYSSNNAGVVSLRNNNRESSNLYANAFDMYSGEQYYLRTAKTTGSYGNGFQITLGSGVTNGATMTLSASQNDTQINLAQGGANGYLQVVDNAARLVVRDNSGNNTWYQPTQISAWTNGGTSQSLITPGVDAISFNKTIQVPAGSSFLVSGACRYAGSYINRYGGTLDLQFNDTRYITFMRGQLGNGARMQLANESGNTVTEVIAEGIISSVQFSIRSTNNIAIRSDLVRMETLDGYTYVYLSESGGTPSIQFGDFSQTTVRPEVNIIAAGMYITTSRLFNLDGGSGRVVIKDTSNQSMPISYNYSQTIVYNLSNASAPSGTVINVYSLGVIDAINDVINMIQDRLGTNFSVSASAGQLAGGGQTRGGGAGRGY